ncbi:fungal-specific transcription factor domain-containing protein [Daedaleopsis nitida]|nr:fungal-specific transcription factor domain-containing protein [Daedaleopsis nitida]
MAKNTHGYTPDGTLNGSTPLRRKSEDELESSRAHKKSRTRVSYSCGECHRRKQKCDRQIPCSHCIARKVPELCKSYTPGKSDQDMHIRLARLEQIVEAALPQYCSHGRSTPLSDCSGPHDRHRSISPIDDGNHSQPEDEDPSGGMFEGGRWYGKSASGLVAAPAVLEQLQSMVPSPAAESSSGNSAYGMNKSTADMLDQKPTLAPMEQTATERLQRLMRDCGYSADRLQNMYDELPPQKMRDDLVEHYFSAINWSRYPISEREFRVSYDSFLASQHNQGNPSNLRFLPLLFVVLAISVRLAPDRIGGNEQTRKTASSRFYWCSRRALLVIAAIQPDCFEIVLTRMLSARFLVLDRRMTEAWSQLGAAVRTAQAIGLHRDGADMGMDLVQTERRRRIWSNLYHADRSIALVLGRPIAIHDSYTSTRPPTNSDEKTYIGGVITLKDLPLSQPTRTTFLILRHQLAAIMGRMSDFFQNADSHRHYADVLALDDQLLQYKQNLPSYYSLDPDTSLDSSHSYIPLQRFLLVTEFLFVRISLHRPYLLRKLDSNKYSRSRDACFESALKDHQIRQDYIAMITREGRDPVASAYREFQASMIAGIYLVLYPRGKDAVQMHTLLDNFLTRYERIPEMDDITRREIKIIEFLKHKASQCAGTPENSSEQMAVDRDLSSRSFFGGCVPSSNSRATAQRSHASTLPVVTNSSFASVASVPLASPKQPFTQLSRPPPVQQVQQLQHSESSQSGTGSPQEDEMAQSLLDQWCNIFSGGPAVDDQPGATGLPWATPGLGGDVNGWLGVGQSASSPLLTGGDALPNVDGSDWSYWETLVNQIRGGSVS